ncbi:MAG: hypothetical protein IJT42_09870 [Treponema sp.]|nr:hypothetical protein [Treponema sp.]
MKKCILLFTALLTLASCSSVVVPNYIVDYSDEGHEKRLSEEARIAEQKKAKKQIKMESTNGEGEEAEPSSYVKKYVPTVERDKCVRIVLISDFNSNMFGEKENSLIEKIRQAQPDLIVLTGNIFNFKTSYARPVVNVRYLIEGIKDIAPFYYVSGDTEFYSYHEGEFNHIITDNGGVVLEGKAETLNLPLGKVIVAGLPDPYIDLSIEERQKGKDDKEKYRARIDALKTETERVQKAAGKVLFTALLAHRPEYIDDYKAAGCFDLVLSGHTNGGLWKFGNVMKGLYAKHQGFFPKYVGGVYEFFDEERPSAMVVSRGLSYQKLSLPRIGTNPELVVIDVVPHESRF